MPQKLRCEVIEILDHSERVYSVFLKSESLLPRFLPGQFLHLALDEYTPGDFWPDSRVFSIASTPADRHLLRITYAVKGQFTGRMEAELRPGRQVWVKMPYGEFIVSTKKDVCLLAGGTGITAFTAFLAGLPSDYSYRIHLFYGARHPRLLIFRPLVEAAAQRCPNLHAHFLARQDTDGSDCLPGQIDPGVIWESVPDPLALTYYLSGPPEMLTSLTAGLHQRGVAPEQIVTDAWD